MQASIRAGGLRALGAKAGAGRHPGKSVREALQRHGIGGDRAAVDAAIVGGERGARQALHDAADLRLDGVLVAHIALEVLAGVAGGADEAGMFARAVVVQRGRPLEARAG
ncbi:hypothetical protein GCM10023069_00170 [Shinella granuli]